MTRYMLSVHTGGDQAAREPVTEEDMRQSHAQLTGIEEELKETGAWVFSARMGDPGDAKVVRASGGAPLTTDGPFAESKEHLGGFYLVDAADLDAALGWAARVSAAIGMPIEVRALADHAGA